MFKTASFAVAAAGVLVLGACGSLDPVGVQDPAITSGVESLTDTATTPEGAFLQATAARTSAQVAAAQQASQKAQDQGLQRFAQALQQDFRNLGQQVQDLGRQQNLNLQQSSGQDSPYYCHACAGATATTFDHQYITYQVYELPRMVNDLRYLSNTCRQASLCSWANRWGARLDQHMWTMSTLSHRHHMLPYDHPLAGTPYYPVYRPRGSSYYPVGYYPSSYPAHYPYRVTYYPTGSTYYPYGTVYYPYRVYPAYGTTYYPYGTYAGSVYYPGLFVENAVIDAGDAAIKQKPLDTGAPGVQQQTQQALQQQQQQQQQQKQQQQL